MLNVDSTAGSVRYQKEYSMACKLSLRDIPAKDIYPLDSNFSGVSPDGSKIAFNNFYMERNGRPFFGVSGEWVFGGNEGENYLLRLKELAGECGLTPVFYTCTGWGNAPTPSSMLPLWGGYAYRPWLFYSYKGEHPATEEYVYQDYHKNGNACTDDFRPGYEPETRPYACCEMGGMMCSYNHRFKLPYKSVDAMANVKLGSGCSFLGYYMYHGGSNPIGRNGQYLNESQVCKISYDYQAALGESGQVRDSYRRTKILHYFLNQFPEKLCGLRTVLPEGASQIDPSDVDTLRFAVRTDGRSGFLFVNNFQDHRETKDRGDETVVLELDGQELAFRFGIAADENCIMPFNLDLDGVCLVQATAQLAAASRKDGKNVYVFFVPEGMRGEFIFAGGARVLGAAPFRMLYTAIIS